MANAGAAADGPECRICLTSEHPRGLADLLVEPCSCRGTLAHVHLRQGLASRLAGPLDAHALWRQ